MIAGDFDGIACIASVILKVDVQVGGEFSLAVSAYTHSDVKDAPVFAACGFVLALVTTTI